MISAVSKPVVCFSRVGASRIAQAFNRVGCAPVPVRPLSVSHICFAEGESLQGRVSQAVQESTQSVSTLIKQDHNEIREAHQKYQSASNADEARKWYHQFVWELARHSVAEELLVYPALDRMGDKGAHLGKQSRAQHHEAKEVLDEMERLQVKTPEFDKLFDKLVTALDEHIKLEESEDLALLEDGMSQEALERLGASFSLAKTFVPTRPHSEVPEQPVGLEAAIGLLAAPIDRLRDTIFRDFPQDA